MTENSKIEWCDHTFNPWFGCTKVSAGCLHCYAETLMDTRYSKVKWGAGESRKRTNEQNWKLPLRWNKTAAELGIRDRVFCASLGDWLDPEVPIEWLADLILLINRTPNLDWLLLTKRIEQFGDRLRQVTLSSHDYANMLASYWLDDEPPENVWLGVTVENQKAAGERIPLLLQTPAALRFLSVEPLLEQVSLQAIPDGRSCIACEDGSHQLFECHHTLAKHVDWVIVGGESGHGARQCDLASIRAIANECKIAGIPYLIKQLGGNPVSSNPDDHIHFEKGKNNDLEKFPADLQIRQFPELKQVWRGHEQET